MKRKKKITKVKTHDLTKKIWKMTNFKSLDFQKRPQSNPNCKQEKQLKHIPKNNKLKPDTSDF